MDDATNIDVHMVVELRAWEIRGTEKVLVAERFRDAAGCCKMVWHVPEAKIKGILWVEHLLEPKPPSSADGIE
jgi:hypothetical protein